MMAGMELTRRQAILLIGAVLVAVGLLVAMDRVIERVSPWDYQDFADWMDGVGVWGPLVYIAGFAASMVLAPIPTAPAPLAAAAAFGGVVAFFYTMAGLVIGASLCFWIARRWGRPALRRFLPARFVQEVDRVAEQLGVRVLFLLRLFPVLGVDAVSYGAGFTPIRYPTFVAVTVIASTPTLVLVSVVGQGLRGNRLLAAIGLAALTVFLLVPLLYFALRRRRAKRSVGVAPPIE